MGLRFKVYGLIVVCGYSAGLQCVSLLRYKKRATVKYFFSTMGV